MDPVKYLGSSKVLGIVIQEGRSPLDSEIVKVMFEGDQHSMIMSKTAFDAFATDRAIDANLLQELKFAIVIPKIRALLSEYFIQAFELTALFNKSGHSIADDFDRAANFLWTGEDQRWIPGMAFNSFLSVLEADQVLKKIPAKDEPSKEIKKPRGSGDSASKGN